MPVILNDEGRKWINELRTIADALLDSNRFVSTTIEYPGYIEAETNKGCVYQIGEDDSTKYTACCYRSRGRVLEGFQPDASPSIDRDCDANEIGNRIIAIVVEFESQ